MSYARELLAEILTAQGVPAERAGRAAETILNIQVAAGVVLPKTLEAVEGDAKATKLRSERGEQGKPLTVTVICQRLGMPRCEFYRAIRRHLLRRRAVLRLIA